MITPFTDKTVNSLIDSDLDLVIDCGDNQMAKAALDCTLQMQQSSVITIGAAGGRIDPSKVQVRDLAKQMVMHCSHPCVKHSNRIRIFTDARKRFSVSAVYSDEQTRYLQADGSVGRQKLPAERTDLIAGLLGCSHTSRPYLHFMQPLKRSISCLINDLERYRWPMTNPIVVGVIVRPNDDPADEIPVGTW